MLTTSSDLWGNIDSREKFNYIAVQYCFVQKLQYNAR